MKTFITSLIAVLLVFGTGCFTPKLDYGKAQFEKVYYPGTEKLPLSEVALLQSVDLDCRSAPIVIYSVDSRPVFCTIGNYTLSLDEVQFGSATDDSTLIKRRAPGTIVLGQLIQFIPSLNKRLPLPLTRVPPFQFRQLVLPAGNHTIGLGIDDFMVGGFTHHYSSGTSKVSSNLEAGKSYVLKGKGIYTASKLIEFSIEPLNK